MPVTACDWWSLACTGRIFWTIKKWRWKLKVEKSKQIFCETNEVVSIFSYDLTLILRKTRISLWRSSAGPRRLNEGLPGFKDGMLVRWSMVRVVCTWKAMSSAALPIARVFWSVNSRFHSRWNPSRTQLLELVARAIWASNFEPWMSHGPGSIDWLQQSLW